MTWRQVIASRLIMLLLFWAFPRGYKGKAGLAALIGILEAVNSHREAEGLYL